VTWLNVLPEHIGAVNEAHNVGIKMNFKNLKNEFLFMIWNCYHFNSTLLLIAITTMAMGEPAPMLVTW
jgi:hypothetical protein